MPIHSLHITNVDGLVLFSNYYDYTYSKDTLKMAEFEAELYENTVSYLPVARAPQTVMIK
jgi:hypothetical protein